MRTTGMILLLALLMTGCGEVPTGRQTHGTISGPDAEAPVLTSGSGVTTSRPPGVDPPAPATTPLFVPESNPIVDIAYSVAVVGILDSDDGGPCPTISLDGREFLVYPVAGSHRALPALDGQEVALRGGPPTDPDEPSLECEGPVWVATSAMSVADVDFERPRIHPEPRWDPHYTPLTMSHEGVTVTYDRWFWAILDDAGFTTVAVADEVILHGPSEWIHAQDPSARITRFFDPWKGRFVAALPDEVFDAAYTGAAISSGAWPSPDEG